MRWNCFMPLSDSVYVFLASWFSNNYRVVATLSVGNLQRRQRLQTMWSSAHGERSSYASHHATQWFHLTFLHWIHKSPLVWQFQPQCPSADIRVLGCTSHIQNRHFKAFPLNAVQCSLLFLFPEGIRPHAPPVTTCLFLLMQSILIQSSLVTPAKNSNSHFTAACKWSFDYPREKGDNQVKPNISMLWCLSIVFYWDNYYNLYYAHHHYYYLGLKCSWSIRTHVVKMKSQASVNV